MALVFVRWVFRLLMVLVVSQGVCVLFFYTLDTHSHRDAMTDALQLLRCSRFRRRFSSLTAAKSLNMQSFSQEISDFLKCSNKRNASEQELNSLSARMRLQFCCNATGSLVLTKRNTAVDQTITYETEAMRTYRISADLHKMLPEDSPWSARVLGRCAVVGSSGILKNSSCGREIDSADFVIRFNLALVNDSDVGLKTDLININPTQILTDHKNLEQNPDPLLERVSVYGNASLIIPAFAYTFCTSPALRVLRVLQPLRPQQPVVFFSPHYLRSLDRFWKRRGLREPRLSSGFILISAALELCEHVHVYGFWPFGFDLQENPIPYHYYDLKQPHPFMHRMPEEFVRLLQLHSQGVLTLHLQPCSTH